MATQRVALPAETTNRPGRAVVRRLAELERRTARLGRELGRLAQRVTALEERVARLEGGCRRAAGTAPLSGPARGDQSDDVLNHGDRRLSGQGCRHDGPGDADGGGA